MPLLQARPNRHLAKYARLSLQIPTRHPPKPLQNRHPPLATTSFPPTNPTKPAITTERSNPSSRSPKPATKPQPQHPPYTTHAPCLIDLITEAAAEEAVAMEETSAAVEAAVAAEEVPAEATSLASASGPRRRIFSTWPSTWTSRSTSSSMAAVRVCRAPYRPKLHRGYRC